MFGTEAENNIKPGFCLEWMARCWIVVIRHPGGGVCFLLYIACRRMRKFVLSMQVILCCRGFGLDFDTLIDHRPTTQIPSHQRTSSALRLSSILRRRQRRHPSDILKNLMHQLARQGRAFRIPITAHLLRDAVCLFCPSAGNSILR
jgi:hypothetical protein